MFVSALVICKETVGGLTVASRGLALINEGLKKVESSCVLEASWLERLIYTQVTIKLSCTI